MNQVCAMDTKQGDPETERDPLALNEDPEIDPLGDVEMPCVKPEPIEPDRESDELLEQVSLETEKDNAAKRTANTIAEKTEDFVAKKSDDVDSDASVQVEEAMKPVEIPILPAVNGEKNGSVAIETVAVVVNIQESKPEPVLESSITKALSLAQPTQTTEKTENIEQLPNTQQEKSYTVAENEQKPLTMEVDGEKSSEKMEPSGVPEPKIQCKINGSEKLESYEKLNGDTQMEPSRKRLPEPERLQSPTKKLCSEVHKDFPRHDSILVDYMQNTTKNDVNEIQQHTEQLLAEIRILKDLAQKKESEWNHILHLKKVKEEIYQRLMRRKQVLSFEKSLTINGSVDRATDTVDLPQPKNLTVEKGDEISRTILKAPSPSINVASQAKPSPTPPLPPPPAHIAPITTHYSPLPAPPPYEKPNNTTLPKNPFPHPMGLRPPGIPMFPVDFNEQLMARYNSQMGRQGPVKDVKSIIADYRQRHPETVPKRGRRMKSMNQPTGNPRAGAGKMDSLNNLGMLLNNMDVNQKSLYDRLTQMHPGSLPNGVSFKDILVQFANIQQQNAAGLNPAARPQLENILSQRPQQLQQDAVTVTKTEKEKQSEKADRVMHPPPYPEISLHPVVSSSNAEQTGQNTSLLHGILTKNCGEITITPVQPKNKSPTPAESASNPVQPPSQPQPTPVQPQEDEESGGGSEGSGEAEGGSRLVIDEGSQEEGVPLCQGCRRRDAQFVCAGCANQWYCSRDCQVAAWDDHSEMCSG